MTSANSDLSVCLPIIIQQRRQALGLGCSVIIIAQKEKNGNSIKITVFLWRRRRDSNHRTAFDRYTIPNRAHLNISSKRYSFLYRCFFTSAPDPQAERHFRLRNGARNAFQVYLFTNKFNLRFNFLNSNPLQRNGSEFFTFLHDFSNVICKYETVSF